MTAKISADAFVAFARTMCAHYVDAAWAIGEKLQFDVNVDDNSNDGEVPGFMTRTVAIIVRHHQDVVITERTRIITFEIVDAVGVAVWHDLLASEWEELLGSALAAHVHRAVMVLDMQRCAGQAVAEFVGGISDGDLRMIPVGPTGWPIEHFRVPSLRDLSVALTDDPRDFTASTYHVLDYCRGRLLFDDGDAPRWRYVLQRSERP